MNSGIIENGGLNSAEYVLNRLYVASQDPAIRAMMAIKSRDAREAESRRLMKARPDLLIDREIQVEGGSGGEPLTCPYGVMLNRINDGFYWQKALEPGDFDVAREDAEFDYTPYQKESPQPAHSLKVSVRPQDYVQAADVDTVPRPFSQWRSSGPADGSVGAVYPANSQVDNGLYGETWTDKETGAVYQEFYIAQWGFKVFYWRRVK